MRKAVFLDRDGTINNNKDHYYVWRIEDFEFNPGAIEALRELKARGYLLVVITNQGGVSKGEYNLDDVDILHHHMSAELEREGIDLDEIYICPHHDTIEACLCRKPLPLMIEKAMARFDIDPRRSYMIGDSQRDMEAGIAAGLYSILIDSNSNLTLVLDQIEL